MLRPIGNNAPQLEISNTPVVSPQVGIPITVSSGPSASPVQIKESAKQIHRQPSQVNGLSTTFNTHAPSPLMTTAGSNTGIHQVSNQGFQQQYQAILNSLPQAPAQDPALANLIKSLQSQFATQNDSGAINQALAAERNAAYGQVNQQAILDAAARGMTLGDGAYGQLQSELMAPVSRQLAAGAADAQLQALRNKSNQGLQLAQLLSGIQSQQLDSAQQRQQMALSLFGAQQSAANNAQQMAMEQQRFAQQQEMANQQLEAQKLALQQSRNQAMGILSPSEAVAQSMARYAASKAAADQTFYPTSSQGSPAPSMNAASAAMLGSFLSAGDNTKPFYSDNPNMAQQGMAMNQLEAQRMAARGTPNISSQVNAAQRADGGFSGASGSAGGSSGATSYYGGSTQMASMMSPVFQSMSVPSTDGRMFVG